MSEYECLLYLLTLSLTSFMGAIGAVDSFEV